MNTWYRLPISSFQVILILLILLCGSMMPAVFQEYPAQPGKLDYSTGLCLDSSTSEWTFNSICLSTGIGKTIILHFRVETDNNLESSFFQDDTELDGRL